MRSHYDLSGIALESAILRWNERFSFERCLFS